MIQRLVQDQFKMKIFAVLIVCAVTAFANPILDSSGPDVNLRIINGTEARIEDFPHHVALSIGIMEGIKCGGALVTPDIVISAAHCFGIAQSGYVSVGSDRYMKGKWILFTEVRVHEGYDPTTAANDIAIVKLDQKVTLGPKVQPIDISYDFVPAEQEIEVSGFGYIGDNVDTDIFYWTKLVTAPTSECTYSIMNGDNMMCARAGPEGQATCQGDSGGPVIRTDQDKNVLVGVVSFGGDSCVAHHPVVFTRMSAFESWIKKNMNELQSE